MDTLNPQTLNPSSSSFLDLFFQADWIVKGVILGLVAASVVSWSIIFSKSLTLFRFRKNMKLWEYRLLKTDAWDQFCQMAFSYGDPYGGGLARNLIQEYKRYLQSYGKVTAAEAHRHLEGYCDQMVEELSQKLESRLNTLASIGSASPFVGLFGTVWGIMNSFQSIGLSQNTSLAVVAPGIAEALFATAIGLGVAIPAFIFYNQFSGSIRSVQIEVSHYLFRVNDRMLKALVGKPKEDNKVN